MSNKNEECIYIKLFGVDIPVEIKTIKNTKSVKLYVKNGKIRINKPKYVSEAKALNIIYDNAAKVYEMYMENRSYQIENVLNNDMNILYFGDFYRLTVQNVEKSRVNLEVQNSCIIIFASLDDEKRLEKITSALEKFYKKRLDEVLSQKIDYYSKLMGVNICGYSIKKMSSRYGSCNIKTHKLNFNINLAFMPQEVISSIVVHEIAHVIYPNHSKEFYNFVYKYSKNYDLCQRWINKNSKYLKLFK